MLVSDFLIVLLDDTVEEARFKHLSSPDFSEFSGICDAVEDCRKALHSNEMHTTMRNLVNAAMSKYEKDSQSQNPYEVAYALGYTACVEWIASVISAILMQQKLPLIVVPNANAVLAAIRIINF